IGRRGSTGSTGIKKWSGPVSKGNTGIAGPVGIEITKTVADGYTVPVPINACQRCKDVRGSVGNERRVMIGEKRSLAFEEVQQMRHLLQVGGNVGLSRTKCVLSNCT